MTGFHDVSFPMRLALGAIGGPERRTEVATLASGQEVRNAKWSRSRRRWDVGGAINDFGALQKVLNFFEARQGRLYGFRFRDPLDFSSAMPGDTVSSEDQILGTGDGSRTAFQLVKTYGGVTREITKPVVQSVRVAIDGVAQDQGWHVDGATGLIQFNTAPSAGQTVSAGFEFDCPVRFESDQINGVIEAYGAGRVVSVSLIELL